MSLHLRLGGSWKALCSALAHAFENAHPSVVERSSEERSKNKLWCSLVHLDVFVHQRSSVSQFRDMKFVRHHVPLEDVYGRDAVFLTANEQDRKQMSHMSDKRQR